MREHGAFVWRMLRRLGVGDSDLDDACQEVFVVVCRKLTDFEARSSLKTWLYGICLRTAAAHRRRAHVRREVPTETVAQNARPSDPECTLQRREMLALLDRALDSLDTDKREAFVLYEIEELPMSAVAEVIGCPLQTAYSRHRVARDAVVAFYHRAALARGGGAM